MKEYRPLRVLSLLLWKFLSTSHERKIPELKLKGKVHSSEMGHSISQLERNYSTVQKKK